MADICTLFCEMENSSSIGFSLGTDRGCRRFHIDQVPQRLLVTYSGKGTEWLPEDHANYQEYFNGSPNEKIVKENCETQFYQPMGYSRISRGTFWVIASDAR